MPVTATWNGEMLFQIQFPQGETMTLASVPAASRPGPGPSPMDAVQAALASCSGIDVVHILAKMRKTLTALRVEVEAARREEEPRVFTRIELIYHAQGPDLDAATVLRAVQLSQEKYCSVAAMLRPAVAMRYLVFVNGELVTT